MTWAGGIADPTITVLPVPPTTGALLSITPDAPERLYGLHTAARLRIRFKHPAGSAQAVVARVKLGPEQLEDPEQDVVVPPEGLQLTVPGQAKPGFVRCTVAATLEGQALLACTTLGFAPQLIQATQAEPADFDVFWAEQLSALAAVPLGLEITPAPELSTARVHASHLSFGNVGDAAGHSRIHGVLAMPVAPGPFPAVLVPPGAGVRAYRGQIELAEQGLMVLEIGIHGIPVNLPPALYEGLERGALNDYPRYGLDDRRRHYFRRVVLGAVRASEVLTLLPAWDAKTLLMAGGSQGGWLAIAAAALNPRVTGVAAHHPAYSDVSGYLHGRAGGWPGYFRPGPDGRPGDAPVAAKLLTTGYYDTVNFARRLQVPAYFGWGFNDLVTPPTSLHAAYNAVASPKQLVLAPDAGHEPSAEQWLRFHAWLRREARLPGTAQARAAGATT